MPLASVLLPPPSSPAALRVEGLTRHYADGTGVTGVSFALESGTITALIGANGAGKSTTLAVLAGLRFTTTGVLTLDGVPIPLDRLAPRPGVGFVADQPVVDGRLNAWHWLAFVAGLRQVVVPSARARALAELLQLSAATLEAPVGSRSFGTQRKVALWVEFLVTARVLLLDEPLTGLDPRAIAGLDAAVRQFAEAGGAVLLSTHLLRDAEALASHALILAGGRLVAAGTMADVRGAASLEAAFLRHAAE